MTTAVGARSGTILLSLLQALIRRSEALKVLAKYTQIAHVGLIASFLLPSSS